MNLDCTTHVQTPGDMCACISGKYVILMGSLGCKIACMYSTYFRFIGVGEFSPKLQRLGISSETIMMSSGFHSGTTDYLDGAQNVQPPIV